MVFNKEMTDKNHCLHGKNHIKLTPKLSENKESDRCADPLLQQSTTKLVDPIKLKLKIPVNSAFV